MTDKEKIVLEKYRAKHKKCYDCTWAKACSPTPMIDVWWECELTHKIVKYNKSFIGKLFPINIKNIF